MLAKSCHVQGYQLIRVRENAESIAFFEGNVAQMVLLYLGLFKRDFLFFHHKSHFGMFFSRMRSEGSRFIWGSGGEAVFAESCVGVRNRSQPSATVRNRLRECDKLSTVARASGVVLKACEVDHCRRSYIGVWGGGVCVTDLCRRSYFGVCRGGVCVSDLCRRSYIGLCRGGVCVSDLCRRSYIGLCRGGVCVSDLCRRS